MSVPTTYQQMKTLIPSFKCFNGYSVKACYENNSYIVYSYETQILRIDFTPVQRRIKCIKFNNTFYSRTTRKIQYIIKEYFLKKVAFDKIIVKNWERETHYGKVLKE